MNKKIKLGKLELKKMTITSLQSVKGGNMSGEHCDSYDRLCNSVNTKFTGIHDCCSGYTTGQDRLCNL